MPAARYWRAVGLQSVGGGALELSALHLYLGGARVDAAATLASTFAPASGSLAALQDDDTATTARWLDVSAPGFALVWDFGAGNTQDVGAVRLGAGATYAEWLETLTLQYSSDGVSWATFGSVPAFSWPGAETMQEVPQVGDPHFYKVTSLLHFDGDLTDETGRVWGGSFIPAIKPGIGGTLALDKTARISTPDSANNAPTPWVFYENEATLEFFLQRDSSGDSGNVISLWSSNIRFECKIVSSELVFTAYIGGIRTMTFDLPFINNNFEHIALVKNSAGVFNLFRGGVMLPTQYGPFTGAMYAGTGDNVKCGGVTIDELRITKGVARYTANFTPPTLPFADGTVCAVVPPPIQRAPTPERARIAASAPVPTFSTRRAAPLQLARDVEHGGPGTIYGTTKTKGSPANLPTKARVVLLHQRSKVPVREVWSDPITGAFVFEGIDTTQQFLTLAEDAAGNFRPVAASRLVPEVAP